MAFCSYHGVFGVLTARNFVATSGLNARLVVEGRLKIRHPILPSVTPRIRIDRVAHLPIEVAGRGASANRRRA